MATIDIRRTHSLSSEDARAKGEELAKSMQEKLGIQWKWAGDKITFDAPSGVAKGANGAVSFAPTEVRVEIDLPFLLKAMKGTIEGKVKEKLDTLLVLTRIVDACGVVREGPRPSRGRQCISGSAS